LTTGVYVPLRSQNDILAYKRAKRDDAFLTVLNLTHEPRRFEWIGEGMLMLSSYLDDYHPLKLGGPVLLRPDEGLIIKLTAANQ
jgi:alpha-glucosidase